MKSLCKALAISSLSLWPVIALCYPPPYPEYDTMPQPQPPAPGWSPSVMPGVPRYEHEKIAPDCQLRPGLYRYSLNKGQDYRADHDIRKMVLKIHVNEGGVAIGTLEIHPDKGTISLGRLLLGDEPRREMYVINSYRNIADLRRCSGYQVYMDADRIRLYDKTLSGSLTGVYEPGRQCIRVNGSLVRRRVATGFFSESEVRIQLDNVCLKYTEDR